MNNIGVLFVNSAIEALQKNKHLAERAIAQLSDEQLRQPLAGDTNSIAIIMKHIAGKSKRRAGSVRALIFVYTGSLRCPLAL